MIYAIGDSHKEYIREITSPLPLSQPWPFLSMLGFEVQGYEVFETDPMTKAKVKKSPTAYGLIHEDSKSLGRKWLFEAIEKVKPDDTLVLFYGEIDARIHIPIAHYVGGRSWESAIESTIEAYGSVLEEIRGRCRLIVHGIVPGTEHNMKSEMDKVKDTDMEARKKAYVLLNDKLRRFCRENGFLFYDVISQFGPDGLMKEEWRADETHLKTDAAVFFKEYLEGLK